MNGEAPARARGEAIRAKCMSRTSNRLDIELWWWGAVPLADGTPGISSFWEWGSFALCDTNPEALQTMQ